MKSRRIYCSFLVLVLLCSCLSFTAFADNENAGSTYSYTQIVSAQYQGMRKFCDGYAAVKLHDKWGYIDTNGNTVIPFQYDYALDFSEGFAVVGTTLLDGASSTGMVSYQVGFIDKDDHYTQFYYHETGNDAKLALTLTAADFRGMEERALQFYNGYCYVPGYLFGTDGYALELPGQALGYLTEGLIPLFDINSGSFCYCDVAGNMTVDLSKHKAVTENDGSSESSVTFIDVQPFSRGLAPACLCTYKDGYIDEFLWGFIDSGGDWVIQPQYADFTISSYFEYNTFGESGMEPVCDVNGRWGAIDMNGKTVIPFEYDYMWHQHEGLIGFDKDGRYGYMDTNQTIVIPAQYSYATSFRGGLAAVGDGTSAWLIDTDGNKIEGTDNLSFSTYFTLNVDGSFNTTLPEEYVIFEENGEFGFGKVQYAPALPEPSKLDPRDYAEVVAAIKADLIPASQQNQYAGNINRKDFAALLVNAVEKISGKDIEDFIREKTGRDFYDYLHEYPFIDSVDYGVIEAYALGIVCGRDNGIFDPYAVITRQEAAKMLTECSRALGADVSNTPASGPQDNDIAGWAQDYVNYVNNAGIMDSTDAGLFNPTGSLTREDSFVAIYRLLKNIEAE